MESTINVIKEHNQEKDTQNNIYHKDKAYSK